MRDNEVDSISSLTIDSSSRRLDKELQNIFEREVYERENETLRECERRCVEQEQMLTKQEQNLAEQEQMLMEREQTLTKQKQALAEQKQMLTEQGIDVLSANRA